MAKVATDNTTVKVKIATKCAVSVTVKVETKKQQGDGSTAFSARASRFDAPFTPEELVFLGQPHIRVVFAKIHRQAEASAYYRLLEAVDPTHASTVLLRGLKAAVAGFNVSSVKPLSGESKEEAETRTFRGFAREAIFRNQLLSAYHRAKAKVQEGGAISAQGIGESDFASYAKPDQESVREEQHRKLQGLLGDVPVKDDEYAQNLEYAKKLGIKVYGLKKEALAATVVSELKNRLVSAAQ